VVALKIPSEREEVHSMCGVAAGQGNVRRCSAGAREDTHCCRHAVTHVAIDTPASRLRQPRQVLTLRRRLPSHDCKTCRMSSALQRSTCDRAMSLITGSLSPIHYTAHMPTPGVHREAGAGAAWGGNA